MKRERRGARIFIRDPDGCILLFHSSYDEGPLAGIDYWGVPGGGMERGETVEDTAIRELREETGLVIATPGPALGESAYDFRLSTGEEVVQKDTYFLLEVAARPRVAGAALTPEEAKFMTEHRWWTLAELRGTTETIIPGNLVAVMERLGVDAARRSN